MYLKSSVVFSVFSTLAVSAKEYPKCGDCWCIPDHNGRGYCPKWWEPQTEFSSSVIEDYQAQVPSEIFTLNCNPYTDTNCTTTPPQVMLDDDDAVCAFKYATDSCDSYSMVTYSSRLHAALDNAVLTHAGSCGVCSTTQDLALYLSKQQ